LVNPRSGIARYTASLLREFALQQSSNCIFLYSHRPFQLDFPLPEHWKVRTGQLGIRGLSTAFGQLWFPIWALKDNIDVFWSPHSQLPLLLPPRIRKVLTVHDLVWKSFPQTTKRNDRIMGALFTPLSLRIANHVIAVSQSTRDDVVKFFPGTRDKIDTVYEASSLNAAGATGPNTRSNPYFLFVGSNEPRKNIERMLAAYIQYRKLTLSPFDLILAGSYQWGDFNAIDFIETNDLSSSVHLIHNSEDAMLCVLYAHAKALVMVSLYEGFGLPLVEAMQWGIPLIASNNSAVAEIAGNAALLVDPYDTDAIASAFKEMTEDPATRSKLAYNSKIRGQQFSWRQAASETMALMAGDKAGTRWAEGDN
jgi:glycosyltransferase involved in cell wall biosynthesis